MGLEVTVTNHAELDTWYRAFHEGRLPLLVVVGRGGTGKSESAKNVIGDDAVFISGHVSEFGLYCMAQENRNRNLVLDDLDHLLKMQAAVRIMRALTDSRSVRMVHWESNILRRGQQDDSGIKRSFTTTSNVCIISNTWRVLNDNVGALQDRGVVIHFEPSNYELHRYVETWFDDKKILSFIGCHLKIVPSILVRDYIAAKKLKTSKEIDWKTTLRRSWKLDPKLLLVAELMSKQIAQAKRLKAFMGHPNGGSRATFFRKVDEYRSMVGNDETLRLRDDQKVSKSPSSGNGSSHD